VAQDAGQKAPTARAQRHSDADLTRPLADQLSEDTVEPHRVARGGSFRTPRSEISCSARLPLTPDTRLDDLGFRIVKSLR